MESYLCDVSTLVSMCSELTYKKEVVELLDDNEVGIHFKEDKFDNCLGGLY